MGDEMKGGAAGLSGLAALVVLLPMEAGVPIPVPADLVMFTVGERVAAGRFPLWLAVTGFEGVHIGQEDVSPSEARALIGPARILGVSTHNASQLRIADASPG